MTRSCHSLLLIVVLAAVGAAAATRSTGVVAVVVSFRCQFKHEPSATLSIGRIENVLLETVSSAEKFSLFFYGLSPFVKRLVQVRRSFEGSMVPTKARARQRS